jgi:hypothetical protein
VQLRLLPALKELGTSQVFFSIAHKDESRVMHKCN